MGSHSKGGVNHFLLQLEALRTPPTRTDVAPLPFQPGAKRLSWALTPRFL